MIDPISSGSTHNPAMSLNATLWIATNPDPDCQQTLDTDLLTFSGIPLYLFISDQKIVTFP